ncbi:MAG: hypothetical protein ACT4NY_00055 [Pseudonocardiales bacterium]
MDWSATARPLRLAAGTGIVPTDTGFLVVTPGEDFIVISVEPDRRALVVALLSGEVTAADAVARDPDVGALLDVFASNGVLTDDGVVTSGDALFGDTAPAAGSVVIDGEGVLAEHVAALLGPQIRPTAEIADAAVVIACAEWLPDARWRELDAACAVAGVAWHRGYAEGGRWYAGPLTEPARGPSYGDLRLRRMAASPWPDQLAAYWAWLDGGGRPVGQPTSAGAAIAAGLITADVRAYLAGGTPPGRGVQYGVDLAAGVVHRHPVLPVPAGLMREVP